jgi:hypothetical protein
MFVHIFMYLKDTCICIKLECFNFFLDKANLKQMFGHIFMYLNEKIIYGIQDL